MGVLAAVYTKQLLFDGLVSGMVFGLVAMGIVLVYRSTRVINFAVANLGLVGAGLLALLVAQYEVPFWVAVLVGLLAGVIYGALVELVVIRRLFTAPRVIVLVATIGIAQLSLAVLLAFPRIDAPGTRSPVAIGSTHEWAGLRVTGPALSILVVAPLVAGALGWLLNHTAIGKAVKASSDNPDLARLAGISPRAVSTLVWAIAGGVATLSLALLAGQSGTAQDLDTLGPNTLVRALAAAVIAGMASFPRAFLAGVGIGLVQALIGFNYLDAPGLMDFLVFLAVVIAVYWHSRRDGETQTFPFTAQAPPIPERLRRVWWLRHIDRIGLVLLLVAAVVLPLVVTQPSRHLLYTTILAFAICALSLTVLTGWAGQLSLGQMAFAGIGALLTASLTRGLQVDLGWGDARIVQATLQPLRFGPALFFAVLITSGIAALVGVGALRVRGLYLAVVTLAFALAAQQYLYHRPILRGDGTGSVPLPLTEVFGIDISTQRSLYYVSLAMLVVAVIVVSRLRRRVSVDGPSPSATTPPPLPPTPSLRPAPS